MLLEHNIPVYTKFKEILKEYDKAILVSATGTGKSYVLTEYIEEYDLKALVICPKVSICDDWKKITNNVESITYHKLNSIFKKNKDRLNNLICRFDVLVYDEAHHVGASCWSRVFNYIEEYIIENDLDIKMVGLTATPRRYLDNDRDVTYEFFGGNLVTGYSQLEAIRLGILPSAEYITSIFNSRSILDEYKNKLEGIESEYLLGQLEYSLTNTKSIKDIIIRHMPNNNRKGIVFVDRIESIKLAKDTIRSIFGEDIFICDISSKNSKKKNREIINEFEKKESGYIVSVNILNEGLHIDGINTIIMLRQTSSPTIYIQQIGRGLAASSDKLYVFDFVGNANNLKTMYKNEESIICTIRRNIATAKRMRSPSDQIIIHDYISPIINILKSIDEIFGIIKLSKQDIAYILREYTEPKDIDHIAKALNKDRMTIYNIVKRYGVYNYNVCFSKEEDDIIRKYYPINGIKEVRKYLNRSYKEIRARANELNLRSGILWTQKEDNILIEYYKEFGYKKCMKLLKNRSRHAIIARAKRLGLDSD